MVILMTVRIIVTMINETVSTLICYIICTQEIDFRRFNEVIGTKYNSKSTVLYYLTKYTISRGPWCGVIFKLWTWD